MQEGNRAAGCERQLCQPCCSFCLSAFSQYRPSPGLAGKIMLLFRTPRPCQFCPSACGTDHIKGSSPPALPTGPYGSTEKTTEDQRVSGFAICCFPCAGPAQCHSMCLLLHGPTSKCGCSARGRSPRSQGWLSRSGLMGQIRASLPHAAGASGPSSGSEQKSEICALDSICCCKSEGSRLLAGAGKCSPTPQLHTC